MRSNSWRLRTCAPLYVVLSAVLASCGEDEPKAFAIPRGDAGWFEDEPGLDAALLRDGSAASTRDGSMDGAGASDRDARVERDARALSADGNGLEPGARDGQVDPSAPGDGGSSASDAAPPVDQMPPPDAARPPPDGALPSPPEGGVPPPPDGGMPPREGGMPPPDGGMPPRDGGPRPDAGAAAVDANIPLRDAAAAIGDASAVDGGACTATANTYATSTATQAGCALLVRDTSACEAARTAQGLSGFWLHFSCRVNLTVSSDGQTVTAVTNNLPDYKSNYYATTDVCYDPYTAAIRNPNNIAEKTLTLQLPRSPNTTETNFMGAVVGLAMNGVSIFGNYAAPGDDIYAEAATFDRCGAHPQGSGTYHYHSEPYSITQDDANFVGVLRDGHPIYGRRCVDSVPATGLDAFGGHTSATADSETPIYHYHVNEQEQTDPSKPATFGSKQWFITKSRYRGAPGSCTGC